MSETPRPKLLLIGWDAADLPTIHTLLDAGRMPQLERLLGRGALGTLGTFAPTFAPLLWNSVATGRRPEHHGVLGFTEPAPDGRAAQPISRSARRCQAVWNLLAERGFKTHVVAWPASHPAEPLTGVVVSDRFVDATGPADAPWPLAPGAVHPPELAETFAELRLHPGELSAGQLREFLPDIERLDEIAADPRVLRLAHQVARTASVGFAASYALENEPWDFAAVHFDVLEGVCHDFMEFYPPRLAHVAEKDFAPYRHVVGSAYALLGTLVAQAGDDATVLLVSTHGYLGDHLRPTLAPGEHAVHAARHRLRGFGLLAGSGARADELFDGGHILGVGPTILILFGLPVGSDMAGRPWTQALRAGQFPSVTFTPNWETPPPAAASETPLVAGSAADLSAQELRYNLGLCYLSAGHPAEALPLLEEMHRRQPERTGPVLHLMSCLHGLGRFAESRALLERQAAKPDGGIARRDGKRSAFTPQFDLMRGVLDLAEGRLDAALAHLRRARRAAPQLPDMHRQLGRVYLALRRWRDAHRAFSRALRIDPDDGLAHHGRALALYRLRRFPAAADHALHAATRLPELAAAHLVLGLSLARVGETERAVAALQNALRHQSGLALAHRALAWIYRRVPVTLALAELHGRAARATTKRFSR